MGVIFKIDIIIIIIHCLISDSDPYWAHADYSIYMGRKLYLRKPHNLFPRLLRLACKAPAKRLRVTCGTFTTLYFDLLGNHCCCNKSTDVLVSQTLLYYYRVIRGRLLLTLLPFITIFFVTQN